MSPNWIHDPINEQIETLKNELPDNLVRKALETSLEKIDAEIRRVTEVVKGFSVDLLEIRTQEIALEGESNKINTKIVAYNESLSRFNLLDEKYLNDISRLEVIKSAAAIVPSFEMKSCPLCLSTPSDKENVFDSGFDYSSFYLAAESEINKIRSLQAGLRDAVLGIKNDVLLFTNKKNKVIQKLNHIIEREI